MDDYKIIVEQDHSTVMAHYEVEPKPAEGYQSSSRWDRYLGMTAPMTQVPVPTATLSPRLQMKMELLIH